MNHWTMKYTHRIAYIISICVHSYVNVNLIAWNEKCRILVGTKGNFRGNWVCVCVCGAFHPVHCYLREKCNDDDDDFGRAFGMSTKLYGQKRWRVQNYNAQISIRLGWPIISIRIGGIEIIIQPQNNIITNLMCNNAQSQMYVVLTCSYWHHQNHSKWLILSNILSPRIELMFARVYSLSTYHFKQPFKVVAIFGFAHQMHSYGLLLLVFLSIQMKAVICNNFSPKMLFGLQHFEHFVRSHLPIFAHRFYIYQR